MWEQLLQKLNIDPDHGDWVAALITAGIFMIQSLFFMIKSYSETKEKRIIMICGYNSLLILLKFFTVITPTAKQWAIS